jgi:hypothetical protein
VDSVPYQVPVPDVRRRLGQQAREVSAPLARSLSQMIFIS